MKMRTRLHRGVAIAEPLEDRIDAGNAPAFKAALAAALETSRWLVVDLAAVSFIDSSGIGALLGALRDAQGRGGDVNLTGVSAMVAMLLESVRLQRVLEVLPSQAAAVDALLQSEAGG